MRRWGTLLLAVCGLALAACGGKDNAGEADAWGGVADLTEVVAADSVVTDLDSATDKAPSDLDAAPDLKDSSEPPLPDLDAADDKDSSEPALPEVNVATSCGQGDPLALVQTLTQGEGGIQGIGRLWLVAVSPDGKNLYGANKAYDGVNDPIKPTDMVPVFKRDPATGGLTWLETLTGLSQQAGVAVATARSLLVSPDGAFVYVQWDEGVLTSFGRDVTSGALTLFQTVPTGPLLNQMVVWPDGSLLVGAVSNDVGNGDKLLVLRREPETNLLVQAQEIPLEASVVCPVDYKISYSLAAAPDGHHLYALAGRQSILGFELDPVSGDLGFVEEFPLNDICPWVADEYLTIAPDGHDLYALFMDQDKDFEIVGRVAAFHRDPFSGALSQGETVTRPNTEDYGWIASGAVHVSPDGKHVYANFGHMILSAYSRDDATGALQMVEELLMPDYDVYGPEFTFAPDASSLYVTSPLVSWDQLAAFSRNPESGSLAWVEGLAEGDGGLDGLLNPSAVDVSPDGRLAYVQSSGALSWFELPEEGDPPVAQAGLFKDSVDTGYILGYPTDLRLSPEGDYVYVAGNSGCPTVFARDADTGEATFLYDSACEGQDIVGCDWGDSCSAGDPSALAVSPDGKNVYGVSWGDGEMEVFAPVFTVYSVSPEDGSLTVIQADWWQQCPEDEGEDGSCVATPERAVVSPDLTNVYLSWPALGHIQVFARDVATGLLEEIEIVKEGEGGVPLEAIFGELAISEDGKYLYSAGNRSISLLVRDPGTGHLEHQQTVELDPVPSQYGWMAASGLEFDPSGERLFAVTGYGVTIYQRDTSGQLGSAEHVFAWDPGWNYGLGMAVAPVGDLLFVTNPEWDRLDVFELCDGATR